MKFFRWIQENSLFVHYLTALIVILGIGSIYKMQREARPNVNFHRVAIAAAYPGASPSDIEELVIDPIEEKLAEVDGIEEYRSVSFSGAGSIAVKIDDEYPDPEAVVDELRRKITEVKNLPSEVDDPSVLEIKAINIPIIKIAFYGNLPPFQMKLEVEKLKDYISTFEGVQSVSYTGLEDLQMKVLTDPKKLDYHDLTLIEVVNNLQKWSKQRPGGLLENDQQTANLSVGFDYNEIELLKNFVVRSNDSNQAIRLKDFAEIKYETQRSQVRSIYGDKDAVLLTVVKKPFADIVQTVNTVKQGVESYSKKLPEGLGFKFYSDQAKRVENRLQIVTQNALFGLALVMLLLIIVLDWRSAMVTSVGIPVAILGGITVIYLLGSTMNSLVLIGMIIVMGMLVDDAIVVCENIYSYVEKGLSPLEAALKGAKEISVPVIATVLTTVFAFFPILFMKEIMGQFLRVIPLTVVAMLAVSLFEALIILPVHAKDLMRMQKEKISFFTRLEIKYEKYLQWSLRNRFIILGALIFIFIGSMLQGKALFNRFTLFPATGLEGMSVRVELKKNTPVGKTTEAIKELNRRLIEVSEDSFETLFSTIGQVTTGGASGSRQTASHLGSISINFTSDPDFIHKEKRIVKNIRKVTTEYFQETGIRTSITLDRPGPPIGKPVQIQVTSRDIEYGGKLIDQLRQEFRKMEGVHSLETDLDGDSVKYRFLIDNDLAVSEGVSPSDISATVFAAATGRVTSEILKNNEKVEILVGVQDENALDIAKILNLKVRNSNGQAVPIRAFTTVREEKGPSSIQRFNGLRTITLFGEVDEKLITGKEANKKIRPFLAKLRKANPTVKISAGGGERDRMRALQDTMRLYVLALVLIFMVISLSFQSLIYPFVVLIAIPMGMCGVVWSLVLHGQPLSLMGIIGIVGMSGVVVNTSIILLKFIQEKLREGIEFKEAIVMAGVRRLRPIIITTISTLVGLAPTIYGVGGVDAFVQPLALVLGWGLFVATILSIFALPAIISLIGLLKRV